VHGLLQARRASRDGSSSLLLNPASDAVYVGAESRAHRLMAGAVALGQHRVHSCDRRKGLGGAHVGSARASRVPHSVSRHCPRRQLESRVREAQGRVILFGAGAGIAAQFAGRRGQAVVPANGTPEELRRLARPCVLSIALPLRFYYDLPKRPPKNLWGAYASNVIRTY